MTSNAACLAPTVTTTCSGPHSMRLWVRIRSAMAVRRSGDPGVGAYLVCPAASDSEAAVLTNPGVSKSGSPAPNPITSRPAARRAFALAVTASVAEPRSDRTRAEHFMDRYPSVPPQYSTNPL